MLNHDVLKTWLTSPFVSENVTPFSWSVCVLVDFTVWKTRPVSIELCVFSTPRFLLVFGETQKTQEVCAVGSEEQTGLSSRGDGCR